MNHQVLHFSRFFFFPLDVPGETLWYLNSLASMAASRLSWIWGTTWRRNNGSSRNVPTKPGKIQRHQAREADESEFGVKSHLADETHLDGETQFGF